MAHVERNDKSAQRTYAVLSAVIGVAFVAIAFVAVQAVNSTTAQAQVLTGTFMGLSSDGGSLAFQPEGATSGTSYAFSKDTMWISSTGVVHSNEPATCLTTSDRGRTIIIGVVWTKPHGSAPGTALLAYVRC